MHAYSNRLGAALVAVLTLVFTSGCVYNILPYDRANLDVVISLSAVHDAVTAVATTAPASAEGPYDNLRRDFNNFISERQAAITSLGASMVVVTKLDLSDTPLSADPNIRNDLDAFAAAAPTGPSGPVLSSLVGSTDVLLAKLYPAVDAIKDSRSEQAATFNQGLEKFKLAPWASVNNQPTGTR